MRWMRWPLLLVVLVGVLGMHGLSNGHEHDAPIPTPTAGPAHDTASAASSADHDASAHPGPVGSSARAATTAESSASPESSASMGSMSDHLMAMCLAILLGAVLLGVLRLRRIDIGRVAIRRRIRTLSASVRITRPRPPTLHQLCVLRI